MPSPILPTRNYVISRRVGAEADEDPTAGLDFWPAKGSDELYEALKEAFPAYRTHKERTREAVLEFLLQERDQDAMQSVSRSLSNTSATASFNTIPESAMPSPAYFMQHQHSQGSFHTTPEYLPSPESQLTGTFPSTPATAAIESEQISAIPNSMTVPGLREMTNVWSVSSGSQPRVRTRRAMTEAEKKEYRRKRIDGACSDCRRRRRKCDHESSESDSSSKCVKRTRRTGTSAKHKAPAAESHFLEQSSTRKGADQASFGVSPQQQASNQDAVLDPSLSLVWPEDALLDLSDMGMDIVPDADLFPADALYEFFDFDQGSSDAELHQPFTVRTSSQDVWSSGLPRQQPQHVPSSGMIMPLPSYYAHMEALQEHMSSGGTANSPASPTNTQSAVRQQQPWQLAAEDVLLGSLDHFDQQKPGRHNRDIERRPRPERPDNGALRVEGLPGDSSRPESFHDGQHIPPRDGVRQGIDLRPGTTSQALRRVTRSSDTLENAHHDYSQSIAGARVPQLAPQAMLRTDVARDGDDGADAFAIVTRSSSNVIRSETLTTRSQLGATRRQRLATRLQSSVTRSQLHTTRSQSLTARSQPDANRSQLLATGSQWHAKRSLPYEMYVRYKAEESLQTRREEVQQPQDTKSTFIRAALAALPIMCTALNVPFNVANAVALLIPAALVGLIMAYADSSLPLSSVTIASALITAARVYNDLPADYAAKRGNRSWSRTNSPARVSAFATC